MNLYFSLLNSNKKVFVLYPLVIYWIVLFTLTTLPGNINIDVLRFSDKIKHFIGFLILSVLFVQYLYFYKGVVEYKKLILYTILILSIYAGLDEIHQMFVPKRSAEFLDFLADVFGVLFGMSIFFFMKRKNTN